MRLLGAALSAALFVAGAVRSEPYEIGQVATGAVYYNRPGATRAQHDADLIACTRDTLSPNAAAAPELFPGKPLGNAIGGIAYHLFWDGPIAGLQASKVENCMIVRGWRAVQLDNDEAQALAALPGPELAQRLDPWIGSSSPHGSIVRTFRNEAAHPTGYKTASRPAQPSKNQFSLKVFAETGEGFGPFVAPAPVSFPKLDPKWPTKSLKPSELAVAPQGSALIVARVLGISNRWGTGIGFMRVGPNPETRPSLTDRAPDLAFSGTGFLFAKKEGNWFVLAVPPGRWRISASGFLNYCLGSPSFEIEAGEIVYAGTFRLDGDDLGPDLSLEPAKAYLGGVAADRIRPAVYRNGSRGSCHDMGAIYALEFPGAPFEPGYDWGGAKTR